MCRETTFHDRWTPEAPVKRTDDEGESFITRATEFSEEYVLRRLRAGYKVGTGFGIYELVTAVTA